MFKWLPTCIHNKCNYPLSGGAASVEEYKLMLLMTSLENTFFLVLSAIFQHSPVVGEDHT